MVIEQEAMGRYRGSMASLKIDRLIEAAEEGERLHRFEAMVMESREVAREVIA